MFGFLIRLAVLKSLEASTSTARRMMTGRPSNLRLVRATFLRPGMGRTSVLRSGSPPSGVVVSPAQRFMRLGLRLRSDTSWCASTTTLVFVMKRRGRPRGKRGIRSTGLRFSFPGRWRGTHGLRPCMRLCVALKRILSRSSSRRMGVRSRQRIWVTFGRSRNRLTVTGWVSLPNTED